MNKEQALNLLVSLASQSELPKALNVNDAKMYIDQTNEAINIIKKSIKED